MEAEDMPEPAVFENAIWSYQEYKDRLERLRQFPETMAFLVDNIKCQIVDGRIMNFHDDIVALGDLH